MIPRGGNRFSGKIMLQQREPLARRSEPTGQTARLRIAWSPEEAL